MKRAILLVEDDPLVRGVIAEVLQDAEFEVIEAASVKDAVTTLRDHSEVLVLLTDVRMAGRHPEGSADGLALARAVHRRWPDIGIVVLSGWVKPRAEEMPPETAFIHKPCVMAKLVSTVSEAADRTHSCLRPTGYTAPSGFQ